MINLRNILILFMVDLVFKIIYDKIFTLKFINQFCKKKNLGESFLDALTIGPIKVVYLIKKTILNLIILIICFFILKQRIFSSETLLLFFISIINNLISRLIVYKRHICKEYKFFFKN